MSREGATTMKRATVGSYQDAGGARHELVVRETADGGWQVLDLCIEGARVIDTLAADQDGRSQAEAIARDYLSTVERYRAPARRDAGEAIPEEGGPDARSHGRPRCLGQRESPARGFALPRSPR